MPFLSLNNVILRGCRVELLNQLHFHNDCDKKDPPQYSEEGATVYEKNLPLLFNETQSLYEVIIDHITCCDKIDTPFEGRYIHSDLTVALCYFLVAAQTAAPCNVYPFDGEVFVIVH